MNKNLLSVALCMLVVSAGAQSVAKADRYHSASDMPVSLNEDNIQTSQNNVLRAAPFWTEDFSGGAVPASWTNVDQLTPTGTPDVTFVWSDDPAAVGAAALGYTPSSNFDGMGASNGYVWANSDRGLTAAPGFDHETVLTTDAIDCSAQGSVLLSFTSLIGVFDYDASTNALVQVSSDGVTWVDFVPFPCLETGAAAPPCSRWSANPEMVELDISSVAAFQPTVYVRFYWLGGWEYFWAIDDVSLSEVPDYERELFGSYFSTTGEGFEYAMIPESQLGADVEVGLNVRNFGLMDQTNITLTGELRDPANATILTASDMIMSLAQNDTGTMTLTLPTPTMTPGNYTLEYTITSDQDSLENNPSNDTIPREVMITDGASGVYALDGIGFYSNVVTSSLGTGSFVDGEDDFKVFTEFRLNNDATFYGAEALITNTSQPGAEMVFTIHSAVDIDAGDVFSTLGESNLIVVSQQQVDDELVRAPFTAPVTLTAGAYYLGVSLFSFGNANDVSIYDDVTVPQPGDAGLIYIPVGTGAGLYGNGNAPALRLSLDNTISVNEAPVLDNVNVFPNPTNDILNITTGEADNYQVEMINMLGEVVLTDNFTQNLVLDVNGFAKGLYNVRISSENGVANHSVTVK